MLTFSQVKGEGFVTKNNHYQGGNIMVEFWIQFAVLMGCIFIGARISGIGLGVMGGVGLAIFVYIFGLQPAAPPVDVIFMILAVITAAGTLQAAGGMEFLVFLAEKALRRNPKHITFMAPLVTYLFTFCAGTGHVAYAVLPVIAEVAKESNVRPERPMGIAVIASQQAITASPISAATVTLLALLSPFNITLLQILMICIPSTFIACMIAAFISSRRGLELSDDPIYQEKLKKGLIELSANKKTYESNGKSKIAVGLFLTGALLVVLMGSIESLRPSWMVEGELIRLSMPYTIQIIMLTISGIMILLCKPKVENIVSGSVFKAGATAVVAIFGIAWMGNTFFVGNQDLIQGSIQDMVTMAPWLFAIALFILSILLYSQAATVSALVPLGIALGISPALLIAMFPAVNGYFFFPNYGTVVAAINFDTTGTTRIGKYVLNHSFMIPGLVSTTTAVIIGIILATFIL